MNVNILGVATSKFGELWNVSPKELAKDVISQALINAGIESKRVDALFVGNMLAGILGHQEHLGALFAENFPGASAFRVEGACASGGLALHSGINSILAGKYKTVAVLGIEKMTDHQQDEVSSALMAAGSDEERQTGITFPGLYALIAQAYMQKYAVSERELASISVKNHYHGSFNKRAQFSFQITAEQVLKSAKIADPLKLLDCSPISDGAAAVVITSDESLIKKHKKPVVITASEVATDTLSLHNRSSFTSLAAVVAAAARAYKAVNLTPKDIDVAEIHDCFSIAEAIATEDLGFSKRGQGAKDTARGIYTLGKGKTITNSSGGLKACGHPVGATGIKQIVEIVEQLRNEAGDRQVKGAKVGLTHNVGGSGSTAVIHILQV